jgi:hypothetical protein
LFASSRGRGLPISLPPEKFHTVDKFPPTAQRKALLKLATALNSSPTALRRDECGDWRINGSSGHVYAIPSALARQGTIAQPRSGAQPSRKGFAIYVMTETSRQWTFAQRALSFATLMQDGDTEGSMFLDRLPTKDEADIIRKAVGIRKRRSFSPEHIEKLRAGALLRGGFQPMECPSLPERSDRAHA